MHQLDGLAETWLAEIRAAHPANSFFLAESCRLLLTPVSRFEEAFEFREMEYEGASYRGEIKYNGRAQHRDQQAYVALCVARYLLQHGGYFPDWMAVVRLARALMLPRNRFGRAVRKRPSLATLREQHPHVPTQWICARFGDLYHLESDGYAVTGAKSQLPDLRAASQLLSLADR